MTADKVEPPWSAAVVQGCADVLGDTSSGLTGSEIGKLLGRCAVPDVNPTASKRDRLAAALEARQHADGNPKRLVTVITAAMDPAAYVARPDRFAWRQDRLNEVLSLVGLRVNDEGRVARGATSRTLDDVAKRANALHQELRRRGTHEQVLQHCQTELLMKNNFHASMEASKSVYARLRKITGATGDGATVVRKTLQRTNGQPPLLAINALSSETDEKEQSGFANLLIGLYGMYRNPVAHDPRLDRAVSDDELLELLTTLSMIHRRLDEARLT